ncbi:hypothetical protein KP509_18G012500 [Ceratopteris richardii]|uniref:Uncharacterized protein n=1 Tax=Ceratopteris richardii TaxID=49495 RepID=A0A8T2SMJ8_CERRI|nr:hypothetical protein KP509_18G012500 [Ceratopteris richardii]
MVTGPNRDMAFVKRGAGLKRARVNMNPRGACSSVTSSSSSSSSITSSAAKPYGRISSRGKELLLRKASGSASSFSSAAARRDRHPVCHTNRSLRFECTGASFDVELAGGEPALEDAGAGVFNKGGRRCHRYSGTFLPQSSGRKVEQRECFPIPMDDHDDEMCVTPRADECRIPQENSLVCPPAPRKPRAENRVRCLLSSHVTPANCIDFFLCPKRCGAVFTDEYRSF